MKHHVVLALGSNVGDSLEHLRAGLALLNAEGVHVVAVSPTYVTAPIGGPDQDDFVNIVALAETSLLPFELLRACHAVEAQRSRLREVRWGPRTLDIDIIAFDDLTSTDPVLTLPHPRAAERAFVCVPWHDVDPDAQIPGVGRIAQLLPGLSDQGVVRRDDLQLWSAQP